MKTKTTYIDRLKPIGAKAGAYSLIAGKKLVTDFRIPLLTVLLFFFVSLLKPGFATEYNLYAIVDSAASSGIAAIGFTFVLLVGQLDISFSSVMFLTSAVFMMMLKANFDLLTALITALTLGCVCGAITGFFVANFRLSPFIVTMTMQLIYKGVALFITNSTPVSMAHPFLREINSFKLFNIIPISFLLFLALVLITEFILRRTQFGRNLYLVGGNINTADNLGLKSNNYIWSAYVLQGLFAAIAGVTMMTRTNSSGLKVFDQSLLNVIPTVIVGGTSMAGGRGGAIKTLWGVLLLSMVYNAMTWFSIGAMWQPFVKGLLLAAVIVSDKYMENRRDKV